MDLHVKLDVSELPEPGAADLALVGPLPCVDPEVSEVVCVYPEILAALLAPVRFLSRVLQFVGLKGLADDEALPAHVTSKRALSGMDPAVVFVGGLVEKGLVALVAGVLRGACVDELVPLQRGG